MKQAWFYICVLGILLLSRGQTQNPGKAVASSGPENGAIVGNTYVNESLGVWFPVPDGWLVNNDVVGTEREGEAKRAPGGGLELLVLDQHTGRPFRNRIVLSALDAAGMSATTREYVSKFVKVQIGRDGRELVRDSTEVEFAGKQFFRADYKQPFPGGALAESFVATKTNGYFLGWTFVAGSPEELEGLVNSLQRLSFRAESVPRSRIETSSPGGVMSDILHPNPAVPRIATPDRIRVSTGVSQGLLIKKVTPIYPEAARAAGIQGRVVLGATIDKNGDIETLTLISGDPALTDAAMEAVKQWKYKPYLLQGQPVKVETQILVNFTLSR